MNEILEKLSADYPLLYLNPDTNTQEEYCHVVLQGKEPPTKCLDHYMGDAHDQLETVDTPAGSVRVLTLGNRRDFELVLRGLMAAKEGPLTAVPASQGAAMLTVFNWPRIKAYLAPFSIMEQAAAFKRFTAIKENYLDLLVVLSRGPYSGVEAAVLGFAEDKWLSLSDKIRRYHELTHVICRRLYPDDIDSIRDELVADAVGLYAAFGYFDPEMERRFLGISENRYVGGRLGNYTQEPEKLAEQIEARFESIRQAVEEQAGAEPFALIPVLMKC